MPWIRLGDTSAMHPNVLGVLEYEEADDRLVNEVFGWLIRCATQSAAHQTDYVVTVGTARALAGMSRYKELVAAATAAGLVSEVEVPAEDGSKMVKAFKVIQDPDLIHLRLKAEVEWDRQRRRDVADASITGPVRRRDGDACRYCGRTVNWRDRKGRRGGTYDHVRPGEAATIDTMVVACKGCNSSRQDNADALRLLPVPAQPIIGPETAHWLTTECGIPTEATYRTKDQLARLAEASVADAAAHREAAAEPSATDRHGPAAADPGVPSEAEVSEAASAPAPSSDQEDAVEPPKPLEGAPATADLTNEEIRDRAMAKLKRLKAVEQERRRSQPDVDTSIGLPEARTRPPETREIPGETENLQISADPSRFQQIEAMTDLDSPGRVGTGRFGQVREGPGTGLDGPGGAGTGAQLANPPRARPAPGDRRPRDQGRNVPNAGKRSKKRKRKGRR
ncbi:MAG: hypothetical protein ACTII7_07720 [Galactobacter sp.]